MITLVKIRNYIKKESNTSNILKINDYLYDSNHIIAIQLLYKLTIFIYVHIDTHIKS